MHIKHGPAICPVTSVYAGRHTDLPLWKNQNGAEPTRDNAIPLAIYTAVILPSQGKKERSKPLSGSRRQRLLDKRDQRDGEEEDKDGETPQR